MIRHPKFIWQEDRAFSHGCIRVAKPKELAAMIMKNEMESEKIETAMNSGEEYWYAQNKIPVYIGYFTVWVLTA
jgi:murein L,D-transpeptidase YcbB/YkuD